jgi:AcrR family transcriptional regulator
MSNSQSHRKSTQRQRLLSAIVEIAAREGYAQASIAKTIARAGVSRPTFYEYFSNKDQCFDAAVEEIQERVLAEVHRAVQARPPEQAMQAVLETLTELTVHEPQISGVLMRETLAGGPLARAARDQGILEIEQFVERAYESLPLDTAVPDVSCRMLIGGVYWLLSGRPRREEPDTAQMLQELLAWLQSYALPLTDHRWRTLRAAQLPASSPKGLPLLAPVAPSPGRRRRLSAAEVENQRLRILFAAAEIAEEQGYGAATIAEITRRAGVDSRVFHRLFHDRQEAFAAVHELYFQHVMSATAGAFFKAGEWPERVWEAGQAFTQTVEQNPTIAHIAFVEAHAAGPVATQRLDGLLNAFTIFLQQGYEQGKHAPTLVALEAIAATNREFAYRLSRARNTEQMRGLLPHATFVALAPFLGAAEANRFIEQKLG